jgi:hypothetical protein
MKRKELFIPAFLLIVSVLQAQDLQVRGLPPWKSDERLKPDEVPAVYLAEWGKADNAAGCAPLILFGAERETGISMRRANFHGGWAVAYDTPTQRSSFGMAGAGVLASGSTYNFPYTINWSDGSFASYGLEGGSGPNYLAYLFVAGQKCLYNVWSARGKAHLESLLNSIRMVNMLTVKPDINSIAHTLAVQIPEINADYEYKLPESDESDEVSKKYLYYYTDSDDAFSARSTKKENLTALLMYWYERPTEVDDLVLVSYSDNAIPESHPWLKCFRFDRKTGSLTAADLPFSLPKPADFDKAAKAESFWRMDYKICDNGNVVISASPSIEFTYVALAHWDNKSGFAIQKRGIYHSQTEIADDNVETENYVQTVIRPNFQRINKVTDWAWKEEKESWDLSLEGAMLTYFYSVGGLEKMAGKIFGESYNTVIEYYFLDGHLSFVYDRTKRYTKYFLDDDFDPDKDFTLEERRWYLKGNTCFRGVGNNGKKLTPAEIKEEFLENEYGLYETILQY